jgi:transposase InsO family protein
MGIETLLTPFRSPRADAVAERVVRTLRNECLDSVIPFDERPLGAILAEYAHYYNTERPHRTLRLETPLPVARPRTSPGRAPAPAAHGRCWAACTTCFGGPPDPAQDFRPQ